MRPAPDHEHPPEPVPGRSLVLAVAAYALVLVLAAELAVWGAFLVFVRAYGHAVPVGIAVAAVGNVVLGTAGGRVLGSRWGQVGPGVVWLLIALQLGSSRPEGDLIITNSTRGLAFLLVGAVASVAVLLRPLATPGTPTGR